MSLRRLVCDYADPLEADLARYYGTDLRDLWRGGLTYRRIGVLVRYLPADSALVAALADTVTEQELPRVGGQRRWTVDQHLLAAVVDGVAAVQWTVAQTHTKRQLRPPTPLQRPGGRRGGASGDTVRRMRKWGRDG